jgi:hypothetical protein
MRVESADASCTVTLSGPNRGDRNGLINYRRMPHFTSRGANLIP